jgi:hypothetical protein
MLLSNLYYYRRGENLAAGVRDIEDGEFPYDVTVAQGIEFDDSGEPLNYFDNCRFLGSEYIDDAYVFCASEFYNRRIRQEFPEYDTLIAITEPAFFVECLSQQLTRNSPISETRITNRCSYFDFPVNKPLFLDGAYPAFVKHSKFSGQAEIRVLWKASDKPSRVTIEDPLVCNFCRIIEM